MLLDLLLGPHGTDRYLELVKPTLTRREARAEVIAVRRQTPRSVTLTLRPNAAWQGFRAGQFVRVGVEIDGVRRTRTYSPACSEHADLLVLERVLPVGTVPSLAGSWDLHMLCNVGGRERHTDHYARLLSEAGLELVAHSPLPLEGRLLHARKTSRA